MDTYFASAEKVNENELIAEIKIVSQNPLVSGLLHTISGMLAVLNEHRQIIALNDSFLQMLGIDDPKRVLPCLEAHSEPGGT